MDDGNAILQLPASAPAAGVTPDFIDPVNRSSMIYTTAAVCLPIISLFALFRLHTQVFIVRKRSWQDLAWILGFMSAVSYVSLTVTAVHLGAYGRHEWDYILRDLTVELIRLTLVNEVLYGPFTWTIKVSVLLLYLQIFGRLSWLRRTVYFMISVMFVFYLSTFITYLVLCAPHGQTQLDLLEAIFSQKCERQGELLNIVIGSFNIISDLTILLLPLAPVWGLQMPRRRKISISAIFLTGIVALLSSILSLVYRVDVSRSTDNTWTITPLWVVNIVEMTAGFMVACFPSVASVYHHISPSAQAMFTNSFRRLRSNGVSRDASSTSHNGGSVELGLFHEMRDSKARIEKDWTGTSVLYGRGTCDISTYLPIRKTTNIQVSRTADTVDSA